MRFARILIVVANIAALSACAGVPPKPEELAKVPRVEFGQVLPQGNDYVLHFPAGASLPVAAVVEGNLLEHGDQATMHVTLKNDVYAYHQFVSFDGTNWLPSRKLIDIHLELQIPQKGGNNAGIVRVKIDEKSESK
ncbi:MAG: hypothetical protein WA632_08110 [Gallionella sp.]